MKGERTSTRVKRMARLALDTVAKMRSVQKIGLRHRWTKLSRARAATEWPGRSRKRWTTVPDPTPRHQKAREVANWKRSKVGRATMRLRRRPKPKKKPAAAIRQEIEEAKGLRDLRKKFLRSDVSYGDCPLCTLLLAGADCRCPF